MSRLSSTQILLLFLAWNNPPAQAQWVQTNLAVPGAVAVNTLEVNGSTLFAGTNGQGVLVSSDNGTTWSTMSGGLAGSALSINTLVVSGQFLFGGTNRAGVFRAPVSGGNWAAFNNGLNIPGVANPVIWSFTTNLTSLLAGTQTGGVFRTDNGGTNWAAVNDGLTWGTATALATSGSYLFAGTDNLRIYRSNNNGGTWTQVGNGIAASVGDAITSFAVNGFLTLFAGTWEGAGGGTVYRSTDNGANWIRVNSGLPNDVVWSLAVDGPTSHLFAATASNGVFRSTNNGDTWTQFNTGLPNTVLAASVNTLHILDRSLFLGTGAGQVWRRALGESVPAQPVLISPADGAIGVAVNPTLQWQNSTGATLYQLQISTNAGFTALLVDQRGLTGTSFAGNALAHSTTYYWRVLASNGVGSSSWSNTWSFTTMPVATTFPEVPTLRLPFEGSADVSTLPTLFWRASSGASAYKLQLSTDSLFTALELNQSGITDTSYHINNYLKMNTLHYWRVAATNTAGTSAYSAMKSFQTGSTALIYFDALSTYIGLYVIAPNAGWMMAHRLTAPRTGVKILKLIYFYIGNHATGSASFAPVVYSGTTATSGIPGTRVLYAGSYFTPSDGLNEVDLSSQNIVLDASTGTDFFVGIKYDGSSEPMIGWSSGSDDRSWLYDPGKGAWSKMSCTLFIRAVISPMDPPGVPGLLQPSNGSSNISTDATLIWNASVGTTSYRLQVSAKSEFSSTVFDQNNITSTSQTVTGLAKGTLYYWRVHAINNGGTSGWSTAWSFTTMQAPALPIPVLLAPADSALNASAIPTLIWGSSVGATSYRLQVSTNATFSTTSFDQSNISSTSQQIFGLARNSLYYWRVNASNSGGSSDYSIARRFTTGAASQLYFDKDTTYLALYVPMPNLDWVIAHRLTAPSTNAKITKLSYLYTGDYAGKGGGFFPVVYFASTPTSDVPSAKAAYVGSKITPTFGWTDVDVSSLGLSLSPATGTEFFVGIKFDGSAQPGIGWSSENNSRSWYYNPGTAQWYSTEGTLFIRATIDVMTNVEKTESQIPDWFTLEPNFPNPFNPSTVIGYQIPKATRVTLKIFNMLGELVTTLIDTENEAGMYQVRWNATEAPSGIYFYRLQAGEYVETKKMMVLK